MAPRSKASTRVKAKGRPGSKDIKQKEACVAVIASAFPDFADDSSFCEEVAIELLATAVGISSAEGLKDPLQMVLAGREDEDLSGVLAEIFRGLTDAGIIEDRNLVTEDVADQDPAPAATQPVLSEKRFLKTFSKELKNRERAAGAHEVSAEALACLHNWDNTGTGGMRCQVCNFETKDKSYTCEFGCGVRLCGSCWWKWKEKA